MYSKHYFKSTPHHMRLSLIFLLTIAFPVSFGIAKNDEVYDSIIVGAGWAGLTAARALNEVTGRFMVLEARDRIGGRTFTSFEFGDSIPQDMGSYYITSSNDNPLWKFLQKETNLTSTKQDYTPFVMSSEGNELNDEFNDMLERLWYPFIGKPCCKPGTTESYQASYFFQRFNESKFEEEYYYGYYYYESDEKYYYNETYVENYLERDISVQEIIDDYIDLKNITGQDLTLFMIEVERVFTADYAGNTTELSMIGSHQSEWYYGPSFYVYRQSKDSQRVGISKGIGSLVKEYANSVMNKVQMKSVVKSINYQLDPIEITYELDGIETVVKAETVIVTAPVGVLKNGDIEFNPPLDDGAAYDLSDYFNKKYALEKIGPGKIIHCALYWENMTDVFWPNTNDFFAFAAPEVSLQGRFTQWVNFYKFNGNAPVLMGTVNGDHVDNMMNMTDEEIAAEAVTKLRSIFNETVPDPSNFIVKNWLKDEFSKSAYSYNIVDGYFARKALSLSLPDHRKFEKEEWRLHFAGEATSENYYGLLQGAVYEGDRAAQNVIQVLNLNPEKNDSVDIFEWLSCVLTRLIEILNDLGSLFN